MATEIDKRVVEMQFDNKDFEKNCQASLTTLEKLKMALNFDGAKGLDTMSQAAKKIDFSNITKGAEAISVKFSAMQVAGMTAISELTKGFIGLGKSIWNSTFGLMKSGGMARTLKIEQANFQMKALAKNMKGIVDDEAAQAAVVKSMVDAASAAVQGTAYGLDAAAKTASTLMASGITDAEKMETYLKGIAGAAAMTGRSFEDIGDIFSTVASNGKVMTMQLRQFSSAGLNVAAVLGQQMGKTEQEIMEMVKKGEIGFEDFANALSKAFGDAASKADDTFSGVTTNIQAQIKRIGQIFTDPFVEHSIPFLKEVKAAIQRLNTVIKPLGKTFEMVFSTVMKKGAENLKAMNLSRVAGIIHGIENIFASIILIARAVKEALRELFPPKTIQQIQEATRSFESFTRMLIPTKETLSGLKNILVVLLSPLRLIFNIVTSLWKSAIKPLFVIFTKLLGAILRLGNALSPFTKKLTEVLTNSKFLDSVLQIMTLTLIVVVEWITNLVSGIADLIVELSKSDVLTKFLSTLQSIGNVIGNTILVVLVTLFNIIKSIFDYLNLENFESALNRVAEITAFITGLIAQGILTVLNIVDGIANSSSLFKGVWEVLVEIYETVKALFTGEDVENHLTKIGEKLKELGKRLKEFADEIATTMKSIGAGKLLLIAFAMGIIFLVFALVGLTDQTTKFVKSVTGITNSFNSLRNSLKTFASYNGVFQILIGIAIAIGAVTSAISTLSAIEDETKLVRAATILGLFMAAIMSFAIAITVLQKNLSIHNKEAAFGILTYITGFAIAILALASAVKIIADTELTFEKAATAFLTVAGLMFAMASASILMSKYVKDITISALSLVGFALGIKIVVSALSQMEQIDFKNMKKTLLGFMGIMLVFGGSMGLASLGGLGIGSFMAFIGAATSLYILLGIINKLSEFDYKKMVHALINIGLLLAPLIGFVVAASTAGKIGFGSIDIFQSLSKVVLSFSVLMGVMAGFISLMGMIDTGALAKGVAVLSIVGMILETLIDSLMLPLTSGKFSVQASITEKGVKGVTGIILSLSIMIGTLATFIKAVGTTEGIRGCIPAIIVLGIVFSAMSGMLGILTQMSGFTEKAKAAPIIAMIVGLLSIISAITLLAVFLKPEEAATFSLITVGVAMLMVALAGILGALKDTTKQVKTLPDYKRTVDEIMGICLGITMIIAALAALVKAGGYMGTNPEGFKAVAQVLAAAALFISAALLFVVISKDLTSINFATNATAITGLLLGIASVMGAMAISVAAILAVSTDTPLEKVTIVMGMLTACLVTIIGVTGLLMAKANDYVSIGDSMLVIAACLKVITKSFVTMAIALTACSFVLSKVPWPSVIASVLGLSAPFVLMMLGLAAIVTAASEINFEAFPAEIKAIGLAVMATAVGLSTIAAAMTALTYITAKTVTEENVQYISNMWLAMVVTFGMILLAVYGMVRLMQKYPFSEADLMAVSTSIVIASSAIAVIAGSIGLIALILDNVKQVSLIDKSLNYVLGTAAIIFIAMGVIVGIFKNVEGVGKKFLAIGGAFAIASTALVIMAGAIAILAKNLNPGNMAQVEEAMAVLVGAMAGMAIVMALIAGIANSSSYTAIIALGVAFPLMASSLLIIVEALLLLTSATRSLSVGELVTLAVVLGAITAAFVAIGVLGAIMSTIAPGIAEGMNYMVASFLKFSVAVLALSAAAKIFVDAITAMNDAHIDPVKLTDNITNAIKSVVQAIRNCSPEILAIIETVIIAVLAILAAQQVKMALQAVAFVTSFIIGLTAAMPLILAALDVMIDQIIDHMENGESADKVEEAGHYIGNLIVHGILGAFTGIAESIAAAISDAISNSEVIHKLGDLLDMVDMAHKKDYAGLANKMVDFAAVDTVHNAEAWMEVYDELEDKVGHSLRNISEDARGSYADTQRTAEEWAEIIAYINGINAEAAQAGTKSNIWDGMIENLAIPDEYMQYLTAEYGKDKEKILDAMTMSPDEVQTVTVNLEETYGYGPQQEIHTLTRDIGDANTAISQTGESASESKDEVKDFATSAKDTLTDVAEKAKSGGSDIAGNLMDGLKDAFGSDGIFGSMISEFDLSSTEIKNLKMFGIDIGDYIGESAAKAMDDDIKTHLDYWLDYGNSAFNSAAYSASGGKYGAVWQQGVTDEETGELKKFKNLDEYADYMWKHYKATTYAQDALADYGYTLDEVLDADFDGIIDGMEDMGDATDDAKSKLEEFRDSLRDSIAQAMHGIFDEVSEQEYIDPEEMLYRMSENVRRVGEWAQNIATLAARGMSEGLLNELKDMGPQGAAKVQAFVDMTDEQLKMANRRWSAAEFLPDYATKNIEQAYRDAGYNASLGFTQGVDIESVKQTGIETGEAYNDGVCESLQIESPSKVMERNGQFVTQGLTKGMTNPTSQMFINGACNKIGSMIVTNMQQQLPRNKFVDMGTNMLNGLPEGWNKTLPNILTKITAIANQIINAFMRSWRINSPSKAFAELGEFAMAGLSVGFKEGESDVDSTVERSSDDILNQMKEQILGITDGMSEDGVYEPVIRPVFDLTAIEQGYNDIQSWFATSQGINLNGNLSRLTPTRSENSDMTNQMLLDAIRNINNDDVVAELSELRNDISNLQSAMTNLQVVMNTGALVGQLVDPMDSALGMKSLMNTRGRY